MSDSPKRSGSGNRPVSGTRSGSTTRSGSGGRSGSGTRSQSKSPKREISAKSRASSRGSATKRKDGSGSARSRKSKSPAARTKSGKSGIGSAKSRASSKTQDEGERTNGMISKKVNLAGVDIEERGLRSVNMCGQGMTIVPANLFQKKDIGLLDLSSNNLRQLPPDMKKLTNLVHLDVSRNGIRCLNQGDYAGIPAELGYLPNLQILLISECNLPYLPPAIFKCKTLRYLDISRNKINIMSPEIGNLEKLIHLNAQQTNISTLPPEIAYCQEVEEILLWGNIIESLPETMKEMPNLRHLAINYRSFCTIVDDYMDNLLKKGQIQSEHIPPVLFEMPGLKLLDLDETKINILPDRCAAQLEELYLMKNYFQKLPSMVTNITSLTRLEVSGNLLRDIPDEIRNLSNLKILRLDHNSIEKLPESISELGELIELSLGSNKLQVLPDGIGELHKLRRLILCQNELTSIPDTLIRLEELDTLDLTRNQIISLPTNFYRMKKLNCAHSYNKFHKYGLWLHLNPLTTPPREVWQTEDPKQIYTFLKKLQIMRTENLQMQKLVLLGEAQCGKTSLLRTMVNGKSCLTNGLEESTELIELVAWQTENNVDFLVHDLGGDSVYKTTHPMFMDNKAVYVLVYDHRKYIPQNHHDAIGYWLDLIYLHAPGAVVMVVGTQCDQVYENFMEQTITAVKENINRQVEGYKSKLSAQIEAVDKMISEASKSTQQLVHLKRQKLQMTKLLENPVRIEGDIMLLSSAEGTTGITSFLTELEQLAVDKDLFPHAQKFVPDTWGKLRNKLKLNKEICTNVDDVAKIAKTLHINRDETIDVLRHYQTIGDILWFESVPELKNIVFHNPAALIRVISRLFYHDMDNFMRFDTNKIFSSKGQFTSQTFSTAKQYFQTYGSISRALLLSLWFHLKLDDEKYEFLLDLLPKLDLCYTIPQPEVPVRKTEYHPLMIIPFFNKDEEASDVDTYWSPQVPTEMKHLKTVLRFPLVYPHGLFEKLTCRIHEKVLMRTDWRDIMYMEFESGSGLIRRDLDPETYDCVLSISVRGCTLQNTQECMDVIYKDVHSLLSLYPGLVWYINLDSENCGETSAEKCFSSEMLSML